MEDFEFSPEFCKFIQASIPAVDAAELLLLFHSRPEEWFSAEAASARLGPGIAIGAVRKYLADFEARGLLAASEGRYRFRVDSALAQFVGRLEQAYTQRPVTLVRIIYALRDSKIQSFADAFKLRRG